MRLRFVPAWLLLLALLVLPAAVVGPIQYGAMPNCVDSSGQHLNYTSASGVFVCGTSATASTPTIPVNAQTGTSYAVLNGDAGKLVTFSNSATVAATIAQAGGGGNFAAGWNVYLANKGAGTVTLTPTTSNISGSTKLVLPQGAGALLVSDGTNYQAFAGTSINIPGYSGNPIGQQGYVAGGNNSSAAGKYAAAVGGNLGSASAQGAFVAGGENVAAGGIDSFATGNGTTALGDYSAGFGNNTDPEGVGSFAAGAYGRAWGNYSVAFGFQTSDRSNVSAQVYSGVNLGGSTSKLGRSQREAYVFAATTAGASATRLTTNGSAAGSFNIANLGTSQSSSFTAECIVTDTTTAKALTYSLATSLIQKGANNASTSLVLNGGGVVAGPTTASPPTLQAAPSFTADTSNGGFNISFTPPTGNTDTYYAVCTVNLTTTRYD